jgi:hypothetical protein
MKTQFVLLFVTFILLGSNLNAQKKFTTYDNTYDEKTYDIQISSKDKDDFTLWIDAMSLDALRKEGGLMIKKKQYQDFIDALNEAKLKYIEWSKTAKENNVKELDKSMPIKCKTDCYFQYGDWEFTYNKALTFDFKILESKGELKYLLIIRTGELQSSSNQFMKVDGLVLVFTVADEIDNFVNSISMLKINEYLNKPKADELFK